jgi:hypothetical protein
MSTSLLMRMNVFLLDLARSDQDMDVALNGLRIIDNAKLTDR